MANRRNEFLIKNTIIFTIGNFGSKLISFFLIPIYTSKLSTVQYGTLDLISAIGTIMVPLITLNISESVMRFQLDKDAPKNKIANISLLVLFFGILMGLIILPICNAYNAVSEYSVLIYLYVITLASSQILLCDLKGKELLSIYAASNIIYSFLIAGFNIFFLIGCHFGIAGYLLAYVISNILIIIFILLAGKSYKDLFVTRPDVKLFKTMARYSIVLIPNSFMWWIMNSSDRIMVTNMVGIAANGIYAISYKLPTLINTIMQVFNQAWSYSAIREKGSEDENEYNNKIFKFITSITILSGIAIITFAKPFLHIYVTPNYYLAWSYIPFLTIGSVYLTLATFIATCYTVHKDSLGYLFSGIIGAVINIGLNFLLIPKYQVYGAAIATCISYLAVFIFRLIHTKKYIHFDVRNSEFIIGTVALLFTSIAMFSDNMFTQIFQIAIFGIMIIVYLKYWFPLLKKVIRKIKYGGSK